jgi:hypothetical protein
VWSFDRAILVRDTAVIARRHHAVMRAQRLIAAGLVLRRLRLEIAERRRKAVTAMLERCATQGPERVLQAFGQGNEALATQHDVRSQFENGRQKWYSRCSSRTPAMLTPRSVASVKSDNACWPGGCSWRKITSRSGPCNARQTLQGTPQIIGELARVSTLHLSENGYRPQSRCRLKQRHNLALEVGFKGVRPASAAWLAFARGQPGIGIEPRPGAGAETGLGRGSLSGVRRSELHIQLRLLVCDVSAGHGDLFWGVENPAILACVTESQAVPKEPLRRRGQRTVGLRPPSGGPGVTHPD